MTRERQNWWAATPRNGGVRTTAAGPSWRGMLVRAFLDGLARALPDDVSREGPVALDPSEATILYRGFRDFVAAARS